MLSRLRSDIGLALRGFRGAPGFTVVAVLSIALGIGVTGSIFTLVDQVLLRQLPVRNPAELVQVGFTGFRYGSNWGDGSELSYPMYAEIRDHNEALSAVFARFGSALHVGYAGQTERIAGELVSGTYFGGLGVGAAVGRLITPDDDRVPGGHPVVVLSHGYWMKRFGGDVTIVGKPMTVNGEPYTIIGVAARGFDGVELGRQTQVFAPLMMKAQVTPTWNGLDERLYRWVRVFGRLRPGVTRERAQTALQPYFRTLLEIDIKDPDFRSAAESDRRRYLDNRVAIADASQGRSSFRQVMATPLWVLMATAGGVLLIACANVANLLIARGAGRQREIAVRLALGATRRRIVGQLLVESLLVAAAGGVAGLGIAAGGARMVLDLFVHTDMPAPISTAPDWRIVAFTLAVSTLTGVLFGLVPAFQSARADVTPALKARAGSVAGGQARLRKVLVASQITLSLLLLTGAALFIRTFDNLLDVNVGFDVERVVSFGVDPPLNGYTPQRTRQFTTSLVERLRGTPGVEGAGLATMRLLDGGQWTSSITVEGYQPKAGENSSQWCNAISPGYFAAMGVPILAGRDFTERDARTEPKPAGERDFRVAIVNEKFARHYFEDGNAVGHRIGQGGDPGTPTPILIVGVVRDSKYATVRDETPRQVFFPYLESSQPAGFTMYVRTRLSAQSTFDLIRRTVQQIDASLPIYATRTLENQVEQSLGLERLVAALTAAFGAMATALAVIGLYGVMSYTVSRRTREFGVRVAFGAQSADIRWLVLREVLLIAAWGVAAGLPLVWWLGRYVSAQLYGVPPGDPAAIGAAAALLTLVAAVAGLVPSLRAARLDPTTALRHE